MSLYLPDFIYLSTKNIKFVKYSLEKKGPEVSAYTIAVIPGNGIGREVVLEGIRVLEAAGSRFDIDFIVVRENTEGEYSALGGHSFEGTEREVVVQENIFSRCGVDCILRYGFEPAQSRPKKHLTWATKSNGILISMPYWDERAWAMAAQYPVVWGRTFTMLEFLYK
ncbi:MAG: hypothetical protein K9K64_14775 [Desulfohalobiaceae bacterium]|nr:hypothetical protein [Desulfohalobiaceae bacterium]